MHTRVRSILFVGEDSPRILASDGTMLPSPRRISNLVHRASTQAKFDYRLTLMVMQYGQFTDHDIVITPTVAGNINQIKSILSV